MSVAKKSWRNLKTSRARPPRSRFQPVVEALESRTVPTLNVGFSSLEFFKRGAWDALQETFKFSGTVDSMNSAVIDMANTNPMNVGDTVTVTDGTHTITPDPTIVSINPNVSITLSAPWPSSFPPNAAVTVSDVDTESAGQFPVTLLDLPAAATGSTTSTTGTIANTDTNHPFAFGAPSTAVITTANTSGFSAGQFVLVTQGSGSSAVSLYSFVDSVSSNSIALDDTWNGSTTMSVKVTALVPSSPEFLTYCWDLQNFLTDWLGPGLGQDTPPPTNTNVFPVTPTLTPTLSSAQKTDGTSAAQRISYLYNTFGTVDISTLSGTDPGTGLPQGTTAQAVGLQVAIWELEYGSTFTNLTVNSKTGNTDPGVIAQETMDVNIWANHYLNVSLNKSFTATFLQANGTSTQLGGGDQGMLAVPMITTSQQPPSAPLGNSIADMATVSGLVSPSSGDTVTFNLYSSATVQDSSTLLFTDTETVTLGSLGTATTTSKGYTATATGTDYWVATFNGDSNNAPVASGATAEPVTITPVTPTINTSQQPPSATVGSSIADKATVSGGFNPTGTVTFNLYNNPTASGMPLFTDTEPLNSMGMATSAGYTVTAAGTDYWVATYKGDSNNNSVSSGTGDEPVTITGGGTPDLLVTKTADQGTVTAGSTIGFTITITNPGGAAATGVTLTDHLPPGGGGDVFWTIDTSNTGLGAGTNPSAFTISGPKGSQVLTLSGQPITLAAGATLKVHITSPTNASDVSGGAVGVQSGVNPVTYLGAASDYGVLYILTSGVHTLQITNVTIGANIGAGSSVGGSGMPKVSFGGPGVITGRLDFQGPNTGQFSNNNASNVGPASVNYNVAAVTSAISTVTSLSSSLAGFGTPITINGNQTINESAGQLDTVGGVMYRIFNVTSYSENDGKLVTINGDGSGDPVVFNFGFNSNVNLGGDVAITGNGLSDDKIIWNFTATGKSVSLNNNASSYFGVAFHGILLAPTEAVSLVNANLSGRVFGGYMNDMQIVSGDTLHAPVLNTATLTASNVTFDSDDTSSASITITGPFKPAKAQVADNSSATADNGGLLGSFADLTTGTLLVYVDNSQGNVSADEQARIDDAIAAVNAGLAQFGVNLVDVTATDTDGGADAAIRITIADTSDMGGVPEGILGLEESGGSITIVAGWNWYTGADPTQIGADQYDFQTTVTHELGHSLGLGGSTDINSPMYESLPTGVARRAMTTNDLTVIEDLEEDPLRAAPVNGSGTPGIREASQPAGFLPPVFQLASFVPPALQPASAWPLTIELVAPQASWNNGLLGAAGNSSLSLPTVFDSRGSSAAPVAETLFRQGVFDSLDLPELDQALLATAAAPTRGQEGEFRSATWFADRVFASPEHQENDQSLTPLAPASNAANDAGEPPTAERTTDFCTECGNTDESEE